MRRFAWQAGSYSAAAGLQRLLGLGIYVWMARALPVREYAKFGLLYALQTGVTTFALAGIVEIVVARLREHQEAVTRRVLYARAGKMFAVTALGTALIGVVAVPLLVDDVVIPVSTAALAVLSGIVLAYASLEAQIVRLDELHRTSLLFSFIPAVAGLACGFLLLQRSLTVEGFFLGSSIGAAAGLVFMAPWRLAMRSDKSSDAIRESLAGWPDTIPFVVIAVFGWISGYGNNYVANLAFDASVIAKLTFLLAVASLLQLIATALNQVWSPRFYRIVHTESYEEVQRQDYLFFSGQALVLGLAGGSMIAIHQTLIDRFGGKLSSYGSMSAELMLVLGYYIVSVPIWQAQNHFLAHGRGRDLMSVTLATGIVGLAVTVALMWTLGPIGLYLGFFAQAVARSTGYAIAARRRWPVAIAWRAIVAGLGMLSVGYALTLL